MKIKVGDTKVEGIDSWKMSVNFPLFEHFKHLVSSTVVKVESIKNDTVKIAFDDGTYIQLQGEVV